MKTHKFLTSAEIQDLRRQYLQGASRNYLMQLFEISSSALWSHTRDLPKHSGCRKRKYGVNESFFDEVESSPSAAYWAGFLAADGNVSKAGVIRVQLSMLDLEHLHAFRRNIGSEHLIYKRSDKDAVSLEISSRRLTAALAKLGITPKKSHTLTWPTLPCDSLKHFLRGYFDGDGSWVRGVTGAGRKTPQMTFSMVGNLSFLCGARHFLEQRCDLNWNRLHLCSSCRDSETPTYFLAYRGNSQVARIAEFLYGQGGVCLERKREKVAHLLR